MKHILNFNKFSFITNHTDIHELFLNFDGFKKKKYLHI
jgi:hypothetical protein